MKEKMNAVIASMAGALTLIAATSLVAQTSHQGQTKEQAQAKDQAQIKDQARPSSGSDMQRVSGMKGSEYFSQIHLTSASDLIGREVKDSNGAAAGTIEQLLINPRTADVRFVLLSDRQQSGSPQTTTQSGSRSSGTEAGYVAVPWDQIDAHVRGRNSSEGLTLRVPAERLNNARQFSMQTMGTLTEPMVQTTIITYFAQPSDKSVAAKQGQGEAQAGQTSETAGQSQQSDMTKSAQESKGTGSDKPAASSSTGSQQQSAGKQGSQQKQAQISGDQGHEPHIIVGRQLISVLGPPAFRLDSQLRGATVKASDGSELGSIDQLMIDTERGRVAYALVASGGFLGIGDEWRPVPLQALDWRKGEEYELDVAKDKISKMQALSTESVPTRVRRTDVEQLYSQYQLTPYWQEEASAGSKMSGSSDSPQSQGQKKK
jgi:sporulation protein YlmC with PRC-barrel domain